MVCLTPAKATVGDDLELGFCVKVANKTTTAIRSGEPSNKMSSSAPCFDSVDKVATQSLIFWHKASSETAIATPGPWIRQTFFF